MPRGLELGEYQIAFGTFHVVESQNFSGETGHLEMCDNPTHHGQEVPTERILFH